MTRASWPRHMVAASLIWLGLAIASGGLFVWSGIYDVSARGRHWKTTSWLMETARRRAVASRAGSVTVPDLGAPGRLEAGISHFHEMCRLCHGAPGYPRAEFARGLYPVPPDLRDRKIQELGEPALFWVIQNGLKMTGMPAFGEAHSDEDIAAILAVVRSLPGLSDDQYHELVAEGAAPRHRH